jgi:hypothetical protein
MYLLSLFKFLQNSYGAPKEPVLRNHMFFTPRRIE